MMNLEVAVLDLGDDRGKILKLMLVDLDHAAGPGVNWLTMALMLVDLPVPLSPNNSTLFAAFPS